MMRLKVSIYATFKPLFAIIEVSSKGGISIMMTQDNEKIRKQMQMVSGAGVIRYCSAFFYIWKKLYKAL